MNVLVKSEELYTTVAVLGCVFVNRPMRDHAESEQNGGNDDDGGDEGTAPTSLPALDGTTMLYVSACRARTNHCPT